MRGRKVRSEVAVRQMGTKGGHKEVFAHDEDEGDGTHAEQVFQRRVMAHHQMAGNGIEQYFQAAARAVLGQHLDELDTDHDVQTALQKGADLHLVAVDQQAGHPPDERHGAEQQTNEHQPGEQDLQQAGRLNDVVAQLGAPVAFHMRSGMFHNKTVLSAFCCRRFDKSLTLL